MLIHFNKPPKGNNKSVANKASNEHGGSNHASPLVNNRPTAVTQRKLQKMANNYIVRQPQPIQFQWNTEGVNEVLAKDQAGIKTVEDLITHKYAIHKLEKLDVTLQNYKDEGLTEELGNPYVVKGNGGHQRKAKKISLLSEHNNDSAASTLVHEVAHANHSIENELADKQQTALPYPTLVEKEYDAHIKQDHFNKAVGIEPKDSSFRNDDEDKSVNEDNIRAYVDEKYKLGPKQVYKKQISRDYGKVEIINPWPDIPNG